MCLCSCTRARSVDWTWTLLRPRTLKHSSQVLSYVLYDGLGDSKRRTGSVPHAFTTTSATTLRLDDHHLPRYYDYEFSGSLLFRLIDPPSRPFCLAFPRSAAYFSNDVADRRSRLSTLDAFTRQNPLLSPRRLQDPRFTPDNEYLFSLTHVLATRFINSPPLLDTIVPDTAPHQFQHNLTTPTSKYNNLSPRITLGKSKQ